MITRSVTYIRIIPIALVILQLKINLKHFFLFKEIKYTKAHCSLKILSQKTGKEKRYYDIHIKSAL